MLLYILAAITLFVALFSWQKNDDLLYQDPGERELAQAILGIHGAALQLCTFPMGKEVWDPTIAQDPASAVTQVPGSVAYSYPLAGCDSRGGATEVTAAMASAAQRAGSAFRARPNSEFSVVSMVQDNMLLTFPSEVDAANGKAGENMAKLAAALYDDVYGNTFKSATSVGSYDKAAQRIRTDNSVGGKYLTAAGETAAMVVTTDLLAGHVVGEIPQGAPVLITQLPEIGSSVKARAAAQAVNGVVVGAGTTAESVTPAAPAASTPATGGVADAGDTPPPLIQLQ